MSSNSGRLWVAATPLGNHGDLSPRAAEILGAADFILAEDTRRSGLLLATCGIVPKRFLSLHDHNEKNRLPAILERLGAGARAVLIADAGTPLISDPGYRLVKACRDCGIPVSPVPGPAAPIAALSASGIAPMPFAFLGFPPRGKGEARAFFTPYAVLEMTLVFFERKDRLASTLALARDILGKREGCVAREMTKTHEEFIPFFLDQEPGKTFEGRELLGELTVVLGPPLDTALTDEAAVLAMVAREKRLTPGAKPRDIAKRVHSAVSGWPAAAVYALMQRR